MLVYGLYYSLSTFSISRNTSSVSDLIGQLSRTALDRPILHLKIQRALRSDFPGLCCPQALATGLSPVDARHPVGLAALPPAWRWIVFCSF